MSDEERAELKEQIALLQARLAAQQALLETETRKRIALEDALAAQTGPDTSNTL
ncbi:MAG: hypothetical protein AAFQ55_11870 [Pseudomonadota bacterium]